MNGLKTAGTSTGSEIGDQSLLKDFPFPQLSYTVSCRYTKRLCTCACTTSSDKIKGLQEVVYATDKILQ